MPNGLVSFICRLLSALLLFSLPAHAGYGDTINAEKYFPASGFPQAEQRRLAGRVLGKKWLRDAEAEEYMRRISRRLAPDDEHFIIVADTEDVNAFAYIGGLIVIYRGLWKFADEEDGFIGVVAHEMGHIKLDHVQKSRDNAEQISTLATPLLIAGLLVDDPQVREAVVTSSAGIISGDIIAYSRELEHEADIFALDAMLTANYNPQAMARIFARFGDGGNEYLSTHPSSVRRGAYLSDRLYGVPTPQPAQPQLDYYLLRVKLSRHKVIERQYKQARRAILQSDAGAREKLLAQYGLLLSATKTRDKKLGAEISAALKQHTNPIIIRAVAENMRQRGDNAAARELLEKTHKQHPERIAILLELLTVYERLKLYDTTLSVYNNLPPAQQQRPDILQLAGKAAAYAKQKQLSNYLLAYGQAQNGDFERAQKQIAIAEQFRDGGTDIVFKLEDLKKQVKRELKLLKERRVLEKN